MDELEKLKAEKERVERRGGGDPDDAAAEPAAELARDGAAISAAVLAFGLPARTCSSST